MVRSSAPQKAFPQKTAALLKTQLSPKQGERRSDEGQSGGFRFALHHDITTPCVTGKGCRIAVDGQNHAVGGAFGDALPGMLPDHDAAARRGGEQPRGHHVCRIGVDRRDVQREYRPAQPIGKKTSMIANRQAAQRVFIKIRFDSPLRLPNQRADTFAAF